MERKPCRLMSFFPSPVAIRRLFRTPSLPRWGCFQPKLEKIYGCAPVYFLRRISRAMACRDRGTSKARRFFIRPAGTCRTAFSGSNSSHAAPRSSLALRQVRGRSSSAVPIGREKRWVSYASLMSLSTPEKPSGSTTAALCFCSCPTPLSGRAEERRTARTLSRIPMFAPYVSICSRMLPTRRACSNCPCPARPRTRLTKSRRASETKGLFPMAGRMWLFSLPRIPCLVLSVSRLFFSLNHFRATSPYASSAACSASLRAFHTAVGFCPANAIARASSARPRASARDISGARPSVTRQFFPVPCILP